MGRVARGIARIAWQMVAVFYLGLVIIPLGLAMIVWDEGKK